MIVRGLYVFEIPLLGGKALRNTKTCLDSSIVIRLAKLGKGRLAWCDHIRSLMTWICLSTSETWSNAPVVFRVVMDTFSSRNCNSESTGIVTTCKLCYHHANT